MFALAAAVLALVEGVAGAVAVAVAVAIAVAVAFTFAADAGAEGDVPPFPTAGEGCVLVDFELTLPGVVAEGAEAALDPATAAVPTFGAVLVAFVTTLPVGCCAVTPAGAVPLGATLEGVLVA